MKSTQNCGHTCSREMWQEKTNAKYKRFGLTTDDISEARISCVGRGHLEIHKDCVTLACSLLLGFRVSRCSCRRGQDWSEQAGVAARWVKIHWYNWRAKLAYLAVSTCQFFIVLPSSFNVSIFYSIICDGSVWHCTNCNVLNTRKTGTKYWTARAHSPTMHCIPL